MRSRGGGDDLRSDGRAGPRAAGGSAGRQPRRRAARGVPAGPPITPAPGEAEFRAGWAALEAHEPARAAGSFAAARLTKGSPLAEDASFWEGIALARAGQASKAIAALRRF